MNNAELIVYGYLAYQGVKLVCWIIDLFSKKEEQDDYYKGNNRFK